MLIPVIGTVVTIVFLASVISNIYLLIKIRDIRNIWSAIDSNVNTIDSNINDVRSYIDRRIDEVYSKMDGKATRKKTSTKN